jgi:polyisoprenoid-binding protein YceI
VIRGLVLAAVLAAPAAGAAPGELVVFVRGGAGPVAESFERDGLPMVRRVAGEQSVTVRVVDVADGAPADVAITPLLVYQDAGGRSVYEGRSTTPDRLRNFLRTARVAPQGDAVLERRDIPVWSHGRARIAAPLKITALTGDVPDDHDAAAFAEAAERAVAAGLMRFTTSERVALRRTDRRFHLDLHPFRSGDLLFVSAEVYSQFDCHEPIWSGLDDPVVGWWDERDDVFARAAGRLETELLATLAAAGDGDAFDVVPGTVPVVTWEALDLALPEGGDRRPAAAAASGPLPAAWRLETTATPDRPLVVFRFPAPLDGYAGEARRLRATLALGDGAGSAAGTFEVDADSVTMGDDVLDATIHGVLFLQVGEHPRARFVCASMTREDGGPLRLGNQTRVVMHGTFEMRGITIPLDVRTTLEPIVGDDGRPRLLLDADWQLRLRDPFGIPGPEGPAPANDTLLFRVRLELEPAE